MASNTASNPYPPDGDSNGASPDVVLSWTGGQDTPATNVHDVYFGTNRAAVLNGDPAVHIGLQTDTNYAPPRLTPGTTYYWRVDEVNPGVSPFRWTGPLWNFAVFNGAGEPANYQNGYATWCVNAMTSVNLADNPPGNSLNNPTISI